MKRTKVSIFLAIFIFTATISFTEPNDSAAAGAIENQAKSGIPKAVVTEKAFTSNEVLEGVMVIRAFLVENQGTAPLKVLDVRTSCGCPTAQRPGIIAPGAQGRIVVKNNTNDHGGRVFSMSK